jgi:hypothetical protein
MWLKEQIIKRFTIKGYINSVLTNESESNMPKTDGWEDLDPNQQAYALLQFIELLRSEIDNSKGFRKIFFYTSAYVSVFFSYFIALCCVGAIILNLLDGLGIIKL